MIKIYTLGDFDLIKNGESILDNVRYPYKLIKLFKFFLTFRDKKLIPDSIIEDIWQDEDFIDPRKVLRTQISRLRKGIFKRNEEKFFEISFIYGYYVFLLDYEKAVLDVDIFEDNIKIANDLKETSPEEAIEAYKKAISIYNGEYLGESEYEDWLIPIRHRYERLYLQSLFKLIGLLEEYRRYIEIIDICEKGLSLTPLNEVLNICFMEALINANEIKYAFSHYEYITSKLYRETKSKPSKEMIRLYKRLKGIGLDTQIMDLSNIDERLNEELENKGALLCDSDYFTFLYNLEKRRNERPREEKAFIGIITIDILANALTPKDLILDIVKDLKGIMHSLLRQGDVFSVWNENQIVFILYNMDYKDIPSVRDRIVNGFYSVNKDPSIKLKIKMKQILNR